MSQLKIHEDSNYYEKSNENELKRYQDYFYKNNKKNNEKSNLFLINNKDDYLSKKEYLTNFYQSIPHKEILKRYLNNYCVNFFINCDSELEKIINNSDKKTFLDIKSNSPSNLYHIFNQDNYQFKHIENINQKDLVKLYNNNNNNNKFDFIYSDHISFDSDSNFFHSLKIISNLLNEDGVYLANEHFDKKIKLKLDTKDDFNYSDLYDENFLKSLNFSSFKKLDYFNPPYAEDDDFVFYLFKK